MMKVETFDPETDDVFSDLVCGTDNPEDAIRLVAAKHPDMWPDNDDWNLMRVTAYDAVDGNVPGPYIPGETFLGNFRVSVIGDEVTIQRA